MTLYAHFPSKDDLIVAVLQHREETVLEFFRSAMERHGKRTKDKLRAFFAALKDWFEIAGFRGCAFQNAAVELADPAHPGTEFVRGTTSSGSGRSLTRLRRRSRSARGGRSSLPPMALLVEGAIVTAVIHGTPDAADVARDAALKLVAGEEGV